MDHEKYERLVRRVELAEILKPIVATQEFKDWFRAYEQVHIDAMLLMGGHEHDERLAAVTAINAIRAVGNWITARLDDAKVAQSKMRDRTDG